MIILVSNDDGIHSEGLSALAAHLSKIGQVYVVAPDRDRSAVSHSLTLHRPLRVQQLQERWFAVDGTPTDCINLAVNGILKGNRPDLVVAGINKGANLGDDITYSGTVSAAIEGTLLGLPSVAVSLAGRQEFDFTVAAEFSARLCQLILERGLPEDTLLNVNVPPGSWESIRGVKVTRQGKRIYGDVVIEKTDPRGKKYYWIGGSKPGWVENESADFHAIAQRYISITPLHLDLTNYAAYQELEKWDFSL
ncbi:MAG: 5'/3'-nucleotidase SurE [Nitrospinota bacterium]|nr:MAG: 5'/3'-nucleotidase SurE [Nitrospinota bacterium]